MNPPPISPENSPKDSNSIAHQAAKISLLAVALTIGLLVILRNNPVSDIIGGMLIVAGFIAAIIALALMPAYGTHGILKPGIAGLTLNGLFIIIFIVNFSTAFRKSVVSHESWNDAISSMNDMRSDMKKNFNPKTGITNVDFEKLAKVRESLKNASENSSGDSAQIANIVSAYLDRMQSAAKNYHIAVTKLRTEKVLDDFDPVDQGQFAPKREIIQQFLEANAALKGVITNSEDRLRAEMTQANISDSTIERFLEGFHSSSNVAVTAQIRQCDERLGAAMLDALNVLETDWGHWKFDPDTHQLNFADSASREAYRKDLAAINSAGTEQLQLQSKLVNQPRPQEP